MIFFQLSEKFKLPKRGRDRKKNLIPEVNRKRKDECEKRARKRKKELVFFFFFFSPFSLARWMWYSSSFSSFRSLIPVHLFSWLLLLPIPPQKKNLPFSFFPTVALLLRSPSPCFKRYLVKEKGKQSEGGG